MDTQTYRQWTHTHYSGSTQTHAGRHVYAHMQTHTHTHTQTCTPTFVVERVPYLQCAVPASRDVLQTATRRWTDSLGMHPFCACTTAEPISPLHRSNSGCIHNLSALLNRLKMYVYVHVHTYVLVEWHFRECSHVTILYSCEHLEVVSNSVPILHLCHYYCAICSNSAQ